MSAGLYGCIAERRSLYETTRYRSAGSGFDNTTYSTDVAALAQCTLDVRSLIGDGYDFLRIVRLRNDRDVAQDDIDRYQPDPFPSEPGPST